VARRLAVAGYVAFAPDGLTAVGGYPGDGEKAVVLLGQVDPGKMREEFFASALWLKPAPMAAASWAPSGSASVAASTSSRCA
jgi:carboxymethylenebutenolidase